ncbi:MAG: glycosylase [Planctomycetes bacterium]|nr:glycosylase [Planctomycetota bacterium]
MTPLASVPVRVFAPWAAAVVVVLTAPQGHAQVAAPAPPEARFPVELLEFGPPSQTPLFAGRGDGGWEHEIRERGWIVREGGRWRMWYTGVAPRTDPAGPRGRCRLGHATSPDGLNWTRTPGRPLVADSWIEDVCLMRPAGGAYQAFVEGEGDIAARWTSADGLDWHSQGALDIRLVDGRPIPDGPRGTPAVWLEGGVWHLFYERQDLGIWLATSRDLLVWTNVADEPVIACGPEPYDARAVALDQIVRYQGRYYALYHASALGGQGRWCTCIATSDDLRQWTKWRGNPLLPVDDEVPGESSAMLVFDGTRHRLYTTHPAVRVRFAIHPTRVGVETGGRGELAPAW